MSAADSDRGMVNWIDDVRRWMKVPYMYGELNVIQILHISWKSVTTIDKKWTT